MFGPTPSTNTNRLASSPFGTIGFQAASNHKAHSTAPIIHFWLKPSLFLSRLRVKSLRGVPVMCFRRRGVWPMMSAGSSFTYSSTRFWAVSSALRAHRRQRPHPIRCG